MSSSLHPDAASSLWFRSALIAEPDTATQQLYVAILRPRIGDIRCAVDGRDALAQALGYHPSLLITETRLPFLDGVTLCQLLRSDDRTAQIAIIVVTSDVAIDTLVRVEQHADLVFTKPCVPERLITELDTLHARCRDVRTRAAALRARSNAHQEKAAALRERSDRARQATRSRTFQRFSTNVPPLPPPLLRCPQCDKALHYVCSHIGGVSDRNSEQWDDYVCVHGCGAFEYRHRTRHLRTR
jgi:DNA-binding response OmpR family regulator